MKRHNEKYKSHKLFRTFYLFSSRPKIYVEQVNSMLNNCGHFDCNMSIKIHYLHIDLFPEELANTTEKESKVFQQDIKTMED